jgi:DMSO reductase anchor subunit
VALVIVALVIGWAVPLYGLATLAALMGVLVERWLFFAEAEHVSMLYYGSERA